MNNQIPVDPNMVQQQLAQGAAGLPSPATQGQQVNPEPAPVQQPAVPVQPAVVQPAAQPLPAAPVGQPAPAPVPDSPTPVDQEAADFWNALEKETDEVPAEPMPQAVPQQPVQQPAPQQFTQEPVVPQQPQMVPQQPVQPLPPQQPGVPVMPQQQIPVAPVDPNIAQLQAEMANVNANVQQMAQQVQQPQVPPEQLANQAVEHLAANQYAVSAEDEEMLISEPHKVIPQMAARMHVSLVQQMGQAINQHVGSMVPQMIQRELLAAKAEQQFYGKYPGLSNPQFNDTVRNALHAVRQLNPQANRDQLMDLAASTAAQTLQNMGYGNVLQQQPIANGGMQQPGVMQPQVPQQPYSPAAAVGQAVQTPVPTNPNDGNIWAAYSTDPNDPSFF